MNVNLNNISNYIMLIISKIDLIGTAKLTILLDGDGVINKDDTYVHCKRNYDFKSGILGLVCAAVIIQSISKKIV